MSVNTNVTVPAGRCRCIAPIMRHHRKSRPRASRDTVIGRLTNSGRRIATEEGRGPKVADLGVKIVLMPSARKDGRVMMLRVVVSTAALVAALALVGCDAGPVPTEPQDASYISA